MATTLSLLKFAPLPHHLTRSSLTINLTPSLNRSVRICPRVPPVSASYTVPTIDRVLSMISYTIPFLDTLQNGSLLQSRYTLIDSLSSPFLPMLWAYRRVVRFDFLVFVILYVSLAVDPNISQYVRFNALQAMMLDVMMILPALATCIFRIPSSRIGLRFWEFGYGAIFLLGYVTFVYILLCCVVGCTPYLPFLSSVVDKLL